MLTLDFQKGKDASSMILFVSLIFGEFLVGLVRFFFNNPHPVFSFGKTSEFGFLLILLIHISY